MSCHGCADKFGFLKKEYGCPKCGFSHCKKCLRFEITDLKTSKKLQVCSKCYQSVKEPLSVINALQRLESMDDPAKPPIVVYKQQVRNPSLQELKKGLSVEDQHILERLETLKNDDGGGEAKSSSKRKSSEQVEEEIAERLARLKGEEYDPVKRNRPIMTKMKPETEEDLIARFTTEVALDKKYESGVTSDIEERLARLRGDGVSVNNLPGTSSQTNMEQDQDELTEEDQVQLIMKQLKEEVELEKKTAVATDSMELDQAGNLEDPGLMESDEDIDVDEICGICSEKRATLICKECDDDIYCKACFQELHRELGEVHAPKAFKNK